ncbi:MAG: PepSY domain-containing protein [Candidatus Accumulibacter sp.]|uniref:PepSY domain-containing protein n=1 Tax=Accumulibacter sp. TaxID=2053492 RepID=UPI0025F44C69|nr:PepSY domain-containing protein [Accumulibacter sp.]MCP5250103.1 PepSY domain-containing protein [Accumulibacter sp.]
MKNSSFLAVLAVFSASAVGSVYAARSDDNDALAIADAKVGLAQAVSAAEQYVGGKASRAEYERHKGQWVFDVEVVKGAQVMDVTVKGAQVMDVTVNSISGAVIAAVEDTADREDDHDRDSDHDRDD